MNSNCNVGILTNSSFSTKAFLSTGQIGQSLLAVTGFLSIPALTLIFCNIAAISARVASLNGAIVLGLGELFKAPFSKAVARGICAHSGTVLPSVY